MMRSTISVSVMALLWATTGTAEAQPKAEIVSSSRVWDGAKHVTNPDLIRFDGRWFLACQESAWEGYPGGAVRILTSADGTKWESAALIQSPTRKRGGLFSPTFTILPDGRLLVSAFGAIGHPNPFDPIVGEGGIPKTMAWASKDGRAWSEPLLIGQDNFPLGRVTWHEGTAYSPAIGRICGSIQTIHVMASKDGTNFASRYEETLKALAPYEGELLFHEDTAYCLMTGHSLTTPTAVLGTARAPYKAWTWKKLDQQVRSARLLHRTGRWAVASVWMSGPKSRTSLCEFDLATGRFTELLELTARNQAAATGLAWHGQHLWVSYQVVEGDKQSVHVAKVRLK